MVVFLFFKVTPQRDSLLELDVVECNDRLYKLAVGGQQAARTSEKEERKKTKIDEVGCVQDNGSGVTAQKPS